MAATETAGAQDAPEGDGTGETPEARLVAHVRERAQAERDRLLSEARAEARRIRAEAHRTARVRVREAASEERARAEAARRSVLAAIEADIRARRHEIAGALLDDLRSRLDDALAARWRDETARTTWAGAAFERAAAVLPDGRWTLEHPEGPDAAWLGSLAAERLVARHGVETAPEPAGDLAAGLRIRLGGACLDASPRGLLARDGRVRARLLARLVAETGEDAAPFPGERRDG